MLRLGAVLGYSGSAVKTFNAAARKLKGEGYEIELRAAYQRASIDWHDFLRWLAEADAAFLYISPFSENAEALSQAVKGKTVVALGEGAKESTVPVADLLQVERYFKFGGEENVKRLILFMGKLSGRDFHPPATTGKPLAGDLSPRIRGVRQPIRIQREMPT
jgi:hypothetical protein